MLYYSCFPDYLSKSLQEQLLQVFTVTRIDNMLTVTVVPVQSQAGSADCAVFAIAFGYHAVIGDDVASISFDQMKLREHLCGYFGVQDFSPFPQTLAAGVKKEGKSIVIRITAECSCRPPATDMEVHLLREVVSHGMHWQRCLRWGLVLLR